MTMTIDHEQKTSNPEIEKPVRSLRNTTPKSSVTVAAIPSRVPQATFQEAREASMAIGSGPSEPWKRGADIPTVLFKRDGQSITIRLDQSGTVAFDDVAAAQALLMQYVSSFGVSASILFLILVGLVREHDEVEVCLDDLISAMGWYWRDPSDRTAKRKVVWSWLQIFDRIKVIGQRQGTYWNPRTKESINVVSRDPLFRLGGEYVSRQNIDDMEEPPLVVTITAGPFLRKHRGNKAILSEFGDVRAIASLRGGQTSSLWGQVIGLALNQRFRERASKKIEPFIFTRRLLFAYISLPEEKSVAKILDGKQAWRAREYWAQAIDYLMESKVIRSYRELGTVEVSRNNWREDWLDQKLEILPPEAGSVYLEDIRKVAAGYRKRVRKARRVPRGLTTN